MEKGVRNKVLDTVETCRFGPSFVLVSLCEGIERLRVICPESRYFNLRLFDWSRPDGLALEGMTDAQVSAVRLFEPYFDARWNDAVVYFAAGRCYEFDQSDTSNAQLAANMMAMFEKLALT